MEWLKYPFQPNNLKFKFFSQSFHFLHIQNGWEKK